MDSVSLSVLGSWCFTESYLPFYVLLFGEDLVGTLHSPSAAALRHHFIYQSAFLKLCYSVIDSNLETSYGKVAGEDVAVAVSSNIASDWEGLLSEGRLRALKSLSRRACCVHP